MENVDLNSKADEMGKWQEKGGKGLTKTRLHKSEDGSMGHQGGVPTTPRGSCWLPAQPKQDSTAFSEANSIRAEYVNWLDGEMGNVWHCEEKLLANQGKSCLEGAIQVRDNILLKSNSHSFQVFGMATPY